MHLGITKYYATQNQGGFLITVLTQLGQKGSEVIIIVPTQFKKVCAQYLGIAVRKS